VSFAQKPEVPILHLLYNHPKKKGGECFIFLVEKIKSSSQFKFFATFDVYPFFFKKTDNTKKIILSRYFFFISFSSPKDDFRQTLDKPLAKVLVVQ